MGRYLQIALLTTGLWVFASAVWGDNPPAQSQPAPAAVTATHALDAATASRNATTAAAPSAPMTAPANASNASAGAKHTPPLTMPAAPTSTSVAAAKAGTGPSMPTRGMSMANVEHIFGAPQEKLPAVPDPGTKLHPPITRWVYPDFVVYFEYNLVVHTVLKKHPFKNSDPNTH